MGLKRWLDEMAPTKKAVLVIAFMVFAGMLATRGIGPKLVTIGEEGSPKGVPFCFIEDELTPLGAPMAETKIETQWNDASKWSLIWNDEFDGNGPPDSAKWESLEYNRRNNKNGPDGWWTKDTVRLDGQGNLRISVDKVANRNNDGDPYDYATGMVRSKKRFEHTYGKYEIRCRLPEKRGWWVAFWLMCDSMNTVEGTGKDGAEIDIFEGFGGSNRIFHALHWDGYGEGHKAVSRAKEYTGLHDGKYHTFTLIWTPTEYQFYVDGILSGVTRDGGVSAVPEYIKVSGEISTDRGHSNRGWADKQEDSRYPDAFIVDYVRVYEYRQ